MIDLHCHILPGLDDGAQDLSDSLEMARQAVADGITQICATPHIRHDHPVVVGELASRVDQLNRELERARIDCQILRGGEVAASAIDVLDDLQLAEVALGSGRVWILLEPDPGPLDDRLDAAVRELARRGYRSLIAHPERHLAHDMAGRLARLALEGALVQATAALLLDEATAPGMLQLAAQGLIHVLGSDAHSSHFGRKVALAEAFQRLRQVEQIAGHLDWMESEAPLAIVAGRELSSPFPALP